MLVRPADPLYYREVLKAFLAGLALVAGAAPLAESARAVRSANEREGERVEGLVAYLRGEQPVEVPTAGRPARGSAAAPLTLVVFLDFLCEQCRLASRYLDLVAADRPESLRVVARHFPIDSRCNEHAQEAGADLHPGACWLAQGAECAHRAGRFWAFHDAVFAGEEAVRPESVVDYAIRAGLDPAAFQACLSDPEVGASVREDIATGHALGVRATPTTFVNGRPVVGALEPRMLEAALTALDAAPDPGPLRSAAARGARSPGGSPAR